MSLEPAEGALVHCAWFVLCRQRSCGSCDWFGARTDQQIFVVVSRLAEAQLFKVHLFAEFLHSPEGLRPLSRHHLNTEYSSDGPTRVQCLELSRKRFAGGGLTRHSLASHRWKARKSFKHFSGRTSQGLWLGLTDVHATELS